ncbi:17099_t:CDS:1, partial [Funneliformis geosporum]
QIIINEIPHVTNFMAESDIDGDSVNSDDIINFEKVKALRDTI